ncbi:hypothetical protein TKK_0002134 [Trichogramma kaykai]
MLEMDEDAISNKLQFLKDESQETSIPWLNPSTIPNQTPRKRVDPFPGACIKCFSTEGEKLFINVCHSKEIAAPDDISDEQFSQMITGDENPFVIPMAIGFEKKSKDKDEVERKTFDILLNTQYFQKCMTKKPFWYFTISAIIESINDKYKMNIDNSKYVVLKNKKVMGSLDTFVIEDRKPKKPVIKKPLIQEVHHQQIKPAVKEKIDSTLNQDFNLSENDNYKKNLKSQNYVILKASDQKYLNGYFYLPLSNLNDILIDVGENRIIVENQKFELLIDSYLPCSIDNFKVTANYDNKLQILHLLLPLKDNSV